MAHAARDLNQWSDNFLTIFEFFKTYKQDKIVIPPKIGHDLKPKMVAFKIKIKVSISGFLMD